MSLFSRHRQRNILALSCLDSLISVRERKQDIYAIILCDCPTNNQHPPMSYEAAKKLLSSRTISKSAVGKLPVKTLSRWCDMQGIAISPTRKRSGSTIKCDYVHWSYLDICVSLVLENRYGKTNSYLQRGKAIAMTSQLKSTTCGLTPMDEVIENSSKDISCTEMETSQDHTHNIEGECAPSPMKIDQ